MIDFKNITREQASAIIDQRAPLGQFWYKSENAYIGIDNGNGNAWTEEFDTLGHALLWLNCNIMNALSLWQPWASLLAVGAKRYETRSWATNYRGWIAIHASNRNFFKTEVNTKEMYRLIEAAQKALKTPGLHTLPRGHILAVGKLVGCHKILDDGSGKKLSAYLQRPNYVKEYIQGNELLFGDWTPGRFAWEFSDMLMLPEPVPAKGRQGLWTWEGEERPA